MSENVQELTSRIAAKVSVIAERQQLLVSRIEAERAEKERLARRVAELESELRQLKADKEYLSVMRAVAPTDEEARRNRTLLNGLVREIDRCIAELKAC